MSMIFYAGLCFYLNQISMFPHAVKIFVISNLLIINRVFEFVVGLLLTSLFLVFSWFCVEVLMSLHSLWPEILADYSVA